MTETPKVSLTELIVKRVRILRDKEARLTEFLKAKDVEDLVARARTIEGIPNVAVDEALDQDAPKPELVRLLLPHELKKVVGRYDDRHRSALWHQSRGLEFPRWPGVTDKFYIDPASVHTEFPMPQEVSWID